MDQIRQFPKYLGNLLLHILISILVGTLLLSAVCMLPSGPMDRSLEQSADVFAEEGLYPSLFPWCTSQLDSVTDSLILLISACDSGENPVVQAMAGTRNTESSDADDLTAHYADGVPFDGTEPYYQYWHGYQLIIRPLLSLFSYSGIRILNGIVQTGLLLLLCLLMHKAGLKRYILPYLAAVAMLMPLALAMSLQFSSCYYTLTISSILILWKRDSLERCDGVLFLYTGIATAYFDFLTYPVATLGVPAIFYFCLRSNSDIRNTFCRGVKICFSWAVGYIGMWAGKWLIGSLILRQNILTLAGEKLAQRSSADAAGSDLFHNIHAALSANLRSFLHTPATVLVLALAIVLMYLLAKRLRAKEISWTETEKIFFPFFILALLPIAWYVVSSQHAVIHHWFTHKSLVTSVFAGLAALTKASEIKKHA